MLHLQIGDGSVPDMCVKSPNAYFNLNFENNWIISPLMREAVRVIDKSDVIHERGIESPFLGLITPFELSAGMRLMACLYNDNLRLYDFDKCGDNCAWCIQRIVSEREILA